MSWLGSCLHCTLQGSQPRARCGRQRGWLSWRVRSGGCVSALLPHGASCKEPQPPRDPPASFPWWGSFSQGLFLKQETCSCPVLKYCTCKLYITIRSQFPATSFCFPRSRRIWGSLLLTFLHFCAFLNLEMMRFPVDLWVRSVLGLTYNQGQAGFFPFTEWHLVCVSPVSLCSIPQRLRVFRDSLALDLWFTWVTRKWYIQWASWGRYFLISLCYWLGL